MPPKKKLGTSTKLVVTTRKPAKKAREEIEEEEQEDTARSRSASPRGPSPPTGVPSETIETAGSSQGTKTKTKKTQSAPKNILTDEKEVALSEWLRDNECIYRTTLKKFHDAPHKKGLWEEKAELLGLESGTLLRTIYNSIRTRVGKLQKLKSGSGSREWSERDLFLWQNFSFLTDHIIRVKGITAVTISIK